jgi:hypothetical protein
MAHRALPRSLTAKFMMEESEKPNQTIFHPLEEKNLNDFRKY